PVEALDRCAAWDGRGPAHRRRVGAVRGRYAGGRRRQADLDGVRGCRWAWSGAIARVHAEGVGGAVGEPCHHLTRRRATRREWHTRGISHVGRDRVAGDAGAAVTRRYGPAHGRLLAIRAGGGYDLRRAGRGRGRDGVRRSDRTRSRAVDGGDLEGVRGAVREPGGHEGGRRRIDRPTRLRRVPYIRSYGVTGNAGAAVRCRSLPVHRG